MTHPFRILTTSSSRQVAFLCALLVLGACKKEESFAGSYRTTWGSAVLTQEGPLVIGTYPRGSLRCRVETPKLACDWQEGSAHGKAVLVREPGDVSRSLKGTWGRFDSVDDGGAWVFAPIPK
jgi:hypothetical protein